MSRSKGAALAAGSGLACVVAVLAVTATMMAVLGGGFGCLGGAATALAQPASPAAKREIPPKRLALYQAAGRRFDIDWTFVASIGTQECGSGTCAEVNPSGCGGPMQIAMVRESACSPGPGPTIWETYRVDGGGDGRADPFDLADSIFTAARLMRVVMHAPPAGGSYAAYREAACSYYGACATGSVDYANEVMRRAVSYGFPASGGGGGGAGQLSGGGCTASASLAAGDLGAVRKAFAPRRLAVLPRDVSASPGISCDARIVPDVVYLARRFGILVTSCYSPSGHEATGEHPLGAAIDAAPRDGDWTRTARLARVVGWSPSCAASGAAPACANPPFRWVGYNGYPNHGDPAHCVPCGGGPHIHISWLTSASPGEPENRVRSGYEPASWIDVFATSSESANAKG